MSEAVASEMPEWQGKARSCANRAIVEGVRRLGSFVDAIRADVLVGVCGASVVGLYAHMYYVLPWVLWRHVLVDTLAFLLLPFLLAAYSETIGDIGEFLEYEDLKASHDYTLGVDVHLWGARKYYEYVTHTSMHFVSAPYDVSSSEEDPVAGEEEGVRPEAPEEVLTREYLCEVLRA